MLRWKLCDHHYNTLVQLLMLLSVPPLEVYDDHSHHPLHSPCHKVQFLLPCSYPRARCKATNQQDSPDDTVTRTTKEEDPQAHELIHRDQYASNFTHCPLKLLIINYLNNLDSYLPRWTISPRKNEEQNTVKTKQSGVQTAKKTGPFSSTHHACR